MSVFVVNFCELKACLHWRINNRCVLNSMLIAPAIKYTLNLHNSTVCEVRKQVNQYRLEHMLEK